MTRLMLAALFALSLIGAARAQVVTSTVPNPVPVARGGTNCTVASITCLNNITGFAYTGTTGGTTANLVGSASPTFSGTIGGAVTFSGALTLSSALTYGGVALSNSVQGTGSMVLATSPTLTTPAIGVATGTSLALGGCTLGADAFCSNGSTTFTGGTVTFPSQGGIFLGGLRNGTSAGFGWVAINTIGTNSTGVIGFTATSDGTTALDTAFSRVSAGVIAVGNGTAANKSGSIQGTSMTFTGTAIIFSGLATGTNADTVCYKADGTLLIQAAACTISSKRFKDQLGFFAGSALAEIDKLPIAQFRMKQDEKHPNFDPNDRSLQLGLYAEDVAKMDKRCAIFEQDMKTPKSWRQECLIALLVKGEQELRAANDNLARRVDRLEYTNDNLRKSLNGRRH